MCGFNRDDSTKTSTMQHKYNHDKVKESVDDKIQMPSFKSVSDNILDRDEDGVTDGHGVDDKHNIPK